MAGATLFLPFLPMLPTQILLNNILYDISEVPIPLDKVDTIIIRPRGNPLKSHANPVLTLEPLFIQRANARPRPARPLI
ncbi:hypothetical protein [Pseudomonas defluvii]|uniref:hypothetical protein n=1 Tax=Pseudomonas defluvii TaxID=1876757 RepID=UPI00081192F7|nr:hypothetical protein [Pseudomonas defluvii]